MFLGSPDISNCVNVIILFITDVDRGWGLLEEDKVLHYKILIVLM